MSTVLIQGRSITNLDPLLGNRGKVEEINVANGAACVTSLQLSFVKYTIGSYTYMCDAVMGAARSSALWRVMRLDNTTGDMVYATGSDGVVGSFTCVGTNANMTALTYTLGA